MGNFILYDNDKNIINLIVCESKEIAEELFDLNAMEYDPSEKNIHTWWIWNEEEQDFVFPPEGEPEGFNIFEDQPIGEEPESSEV
jgi:hypothetical protein